MKYIFITFESLYYFWRFRRAHQDQKIPFQDLMSNAYRPRFVPTVYGTGHLSWALRLLRHVSRLLKDRNHCLLVSLTLLHLCHSEACMFVGAYDFKNRPGDLHAWIVYRGQVFTTDQRIPSAILVQYPKPFTGDIGSAAQIFEF